MLILTLRKPYKERNEWVEIVTKSGEKITVHLSQVKGKQVRVGFECDKGIKINRKGTFEYKGDGYGKEGLS
jgi:sRNA-binding carbon storage regulator CsrA